MQLRDVASAFVVLLLSLEVDEVLAVVAQGLAPANQGLLGPADLLFLLSLEGMEYLKLLIPNLLEILLPGPLKVGNLLHIGAFDGALLGHLAAANARHVCAQHQGVGSPDLLVDIARLGVPAVVQQLLLLLLQTRAK